MNIFKKVSGGARDLFKKADEARQDVFKKAPMVLKGISSGAEQAQKVLSRTSKIAGKIAESPVTASIPIIGQGLASTAGAISLGSKLGAKGAGQVSQLTDLSQYRKGGVRKQLENVGDVQRRTRELEQTGKEIGNIFA
jgi:hypothetical protein